jgi:hypothetical protein
MVIRQNGDRAWYPTGLRRHGADRGVLAKARPLRLVTHPIFAQKHAGVRGPAK